MWLQTTIGFFSVVEKPEDRGKGMLTVRSRSREDLEFLARCFEKTPEITGKVSDYPFRIRVPREELAVVMAELVRNIDYPNFKSEVAKRQGSQRAHVYANVWNELRAIDKGKK